MSVIILPIVEGHGEVQAVRLLIHRVWEYLDRPDPMLVAQPIRVKRDRFISHRFSDFEKYLRIAVAKNENATVLVILDADDECPAELFTRLTSRAQVACPDISVIFVFPNRCYEVWFIASRTSVQAHRDCGEISFDERDSEVCASPKATMKRSMRSGVSYSEVRHQPAFTDRIDISAALTSSRSLRKLVSELERITAVP